MFIITNCTPQGNYKPTIAETIEEAKEWMMECAINNIKNAFSDETDFESMSDDEVLKWAKENQEVNVWDNAIDIYYGDDSYNMIEIFEVNM